MLRKRKTKLNKDEPIFNQFKIKIIIINSKYLYIYLNISLESYGKNVFLPQHLSLN